MRRFAINHAQQKRGLHHDPRETNSTITAIKTLECLGCFWRTNPIPYPDCRHSRPIYPSSSCHVYVSNDLAKTYACYPYLQNSYNNAMLSDVVLCFGNDKMYAHKIILIAASGVFHAAFNSKFLIADQGTFEIKGQSDNAVYAMLHHFYNKPLDISVLTTDFDW